MSALSPQGMTPVTAWWQTAAVVLPVFTTPRHRTLELTHAVRTSIAQYGRMFSVDDPKRVMQA